VNQAKEMWDKLVSNYEGDEKVKKEKLQTFQRQFESLKMNDEEDVAAYFLRVDEVVNSLKGLGEEVKETTSCSKSFEVSSSMF
jgi:uncharacterized lipoprotein YehR (DUF1307 family)